MCDILFTLSLLLSLVGLFVVLRTIVDGRLESAGAMDELSNLEIPDVYGQRLVEAYWISRR